MNQVLLAVALTTPLVLMLGCLSARVRNRMIVLLPWAPLPALASSMLSPHGLYRLPAPLSFTFELDPPAALLLGVSSLLWIGAGLYAAEAWRHDPRRKTTSLWWLATLSGSLGVFVAADMPTFYLMFSLVSLAGYGLVAQDGTAKSLKAGLIYAGFAVLSEAALLMAFILLSNASPDGTLSIKDAVAALPSSPWRDATLAMLILGFGMKMGLVPLHVWMPLAYAAAPLPAAAVLSGAGVKAGVIGLIRFLPFDTPIPAWGDTLAYLGLCSAFYGVLVGTLQSNPKAILAYSSVSQMGLIAAVSGMGLANGVAATPMILAFYAAFHILVKGGLFLSIGMVVTTPARRTRPILAISGLLALSLAGLPLTGGALAKLAIKPVLGDDLVGTLALISAAGSALLMLRFVYQLANSHPRGSSTRAPIGLAVSWSIIVVASTLIPWFLFSFTAQSPLEPLTLVSIWKALWPILLGGGLMALVTRMTMTFVPEGDILSFGTQGFNALLHWCSVFDDGDRALKEWPVAGLALLTLTIVFAVSML